MVSDSLSNLINGLKNAGKAGKETFSVPHSKMQFAVLNLLKKEGYIEDVKVNGSDIKKTIDISIKYDEEGKPVVTNVKRVSKFSKRIYKGVKDIKGVRYGYGTLVLSTPKGIMSGREAKKAKVGGEALFEIW